ncbi:hypothetical protein ABZX66_20855 [Micromonospora aurantiaca]|uniref:DUF7341 domain-containing protein n=1 Tax=Micromonospora aurantiaca (nom. illeg.) TaxID=47850 RepID=UPI0033BEDA99
MTTTRQAFDIAQLAEELADARQHIEPVHSRDRHRNKTLRSVWVTTQPGLLDQLADAAESSSGQSCDGGTARPAPGSRPPGQWEALSSHTTICVEVFAWVVDLKLPQADTVTANLRAIATHAPMLDDDTAAELLDHMRRWRHIAAVMTGWSTPMWAPNIACPVRDCGRTTSLRIHTERRLAYCTACQARWDDSDGSYATLATYIQAVAEPAAHRPNRIRSGRQGYGGWLTDRPIG